MRINFERIEKPRAACPEERGGIKLKDLRHHKHPLLMHIAPGVVLEVNRRERFITSASTADAQTLHLQS